MPRGRALEQEKPQEAHVPQLESSPYSLQLEKKNKVREPWEQKILPKSLLQMSLKVAMNRFFNGL